MASLKWNHSLAWRTLSVAAGGTALSLLWNEGSHQDEASHESSQNGKTRLLDKSFHSLTNSPDAMAISDSEVETTVS